MSEMEEECDPYCYCTCDEKCRWKSIEAERDRYKQVLVRILARDTPHEDEHTELFQDIMEMAERALKEAEGE